MKTFKPCIGKTACTEGGSPHCLACGRTHEDIARTRNLIEALSSFILDTGYSNVEDFTAYVASKTNKKVQYLRNKAMGA